MAVVYCTLYCCPLNSHILSMTDDDASMSIDSPLDEKKIWVSFNFCSDPLKNLKIFREKTQGLKVFEKYRNSKGRYLLMVTQTGFNQHQFFTASEIILRRKPSSWKFKCKKTLKASSNPLGRVAENGSKLEAWHGCPLLYAIAFSKPFHSERGLAKRN